MLALRVVDHRDDRTDAGAGVGVATTSV